MQDVLPLKDASYEMVCEQAKQPAFHLICFNPSDEGCSSSSRDAACHQDDRSHDSTGRRGRRETEEEQGGLEHSALPKTTTYVPCILYKNQEEEGEQTMKK